MQLGIRAYPEEVAFLPVKMRLARQLLRFEELSSRSSLTLSQEDLATSLGVSRQSIYRALAEWQERGLINQEYGNVSVVDRGGLEELVNQYLAGA